MKKKKYYSPKCLVIATETNELICMSTHDQEAPFVGAKRQRFYDDDGDDYFQEETLTPSL